MIQLKANKNDAKKVFKSLGTCSRTYFYLLNREFGHTKEPEERAADSLAGGILQKGHQCGMLWGATLAVGAESFRMNNDLNQANYLAISATQHLIKSFKERAKTTNCKEITECNLDSFFGMSKFMIKTMLKGMDNSKCFVLAEKWAPEAIQSAKEGLSHKHTNNSKQAINCASEVVKQMGGSDEEMAMVAGFAGGMGLSGNACGALSAAIWKNSLKWSREHPGKSSFKNTFAKNTLKVFNTETNSEMSCHKLCGQHFQSIEEHSEFIKSGGCKNLINILANTNLSK